MKPAKIKVQKQKITYPNNNNIYFYSALSLSFLITFILYVLTLAPTISFEDSGELVTAAYSLGVPHEPGYPLFTIIGKIFTLIIPFGSIAYRVNLMSAFFTSLACVFVTYSTIIIIEDTFIVSSQNKPRTPNPEPRTLKYLIGLGSGLFFGVCIESWKQAVMTEVYGLNSCVVALFILLALFWRRQETIESRKKYLYIIALIIGISVTTHMTSLMLIPVFGVFLLAVDYKIILNVRTIFKTLLFFIWGLTPFLYLPLASLRKPLMNWGKPDNLTNFIRVVTRHQYRGNYPHTAERFICQFKYFTNLLLPQQWYWVFLIFALIGIIIIFRQNKKFFWFALMFLFCSMPLLTYVVNADISCNADITDVTGGMASVFYIPSYMFLSILIGVGYFYLILTAIFYFKLNIKYLSFPLGIVFVFMALYSVFKNYRDADMSNYYYPEKYFNNTCKLATKNSMVLGDWDAYTFPFFYYQLVEHKRKDIISIDISLLKRSWYIEWLKIQYPLLIKNSQTEVDRFLQAVSPFENSEQYDGSVIQSCYENMIYSFIDNNLRQGKDVYITYINPESQQVLKKYIKEPVYAAFKIPRESSITKIEYTDFDLKDFINSNNSKDGILVKFNEYYGDLVLSRANMFYKMNNKIEAIKNYNLALPFYKNDANAQDFIYDKLKQLK